LRLIGDLPAGTPVAFEAAFGWGWLVRLLEDYGFDPHLVHPLRCKAIASARLKNNKVDAAILAQLLRADRPRRPASDDREAGRGAVAVCEAVPRHSRPLSQIHARPAAVPSRGEDPDGELPFGAQPPIDLGVGEVHGVSFVEGGDTHRVIGALSRPIENTLRTASPPSRSRHSSRPPSRPARRP
jgi:hypothetical protein